MDAQLQAIVDDTKAKAMAHVKALLEEVLVGAIPAALDYAVKKSATPIDDMVVMALKPSMDQYLKALVAKL